jgi:hypothetical protein
MSEFTITKHWLNKHQTHKGGYTRGQIEALNLPWPPPPKWKKAICGTVIGGNEKVAFEESRKSTSDPKTITVKCLVRDFTKAQLTEIIDYTINLREVIKNGMS